MADKSAALFRASNIHILDYPFEAAIESACCLFDEVVIVADGRSIDDTWYSLSSLAVRNSQIILTTMRFFWDREWQQRWWERAASHTDAEWLAWLDLDEVIDVKHWDAVQAAMSDETTHLINFPFVHYYGTSQYEIKLPLTHNTRIGRRSKGYKMINRCTDRRPHDACCFAAYGSSEQNAHTMQGEHIRRLSAPILHYGWCRDEAALAISQMKQKAWYADGGALIDGKLPPDVDEHDFRMTERLADRALVKRVDSHPDVMESWLDEHYPQYQVLNAEAEAGSKPVAVKSVRTLKE